MPTNKELKEDLENMYNGMIRVGESSDIWQNKLIYQICKANYDMLNYILNKTKKKENS